MILRTVLYGDTATARDKDGKKKTLFYRVARNFAESGFSLLVHSSYHNSGTLDIFLLSIVHRLLATPIVSLPAKGAPKVFRTNTIVC